MSARSRTRTLIPAAALALSLCPVPLGEAAASDAASYLPQIKPTNVNKTDPRAFVRARASRDRDWTGRQWRCLAALIDRENRSWDAHAKNRQGSSAYGLFQILHMPVGTPLPKQWERFARYIDSRYGTPCRAYAHSLARGWY